MSERTRVIYTAARSEQAHLLKNLLADAGIRAYVVNDALQQAVGEFPPGWSSAARVVVPDDQAAVARRIAEEFDARSAAAMDEAGEISDEAEPWGDEMPVWAACPACRRPRTAVCPICDTAGSDFAPGDAPVGDGSKPERTKPSLWICPTCDEPFEPRFLRRCEWCGHDFGAGLEAPAEGDAEPLDARLVGAAVALAAVVIVILAYFAMILSS